MFGSSGDASQPQDEDRHALSVFGSDRLVPGDEPNSLLTLLSYLTILHLIYLVWREESERGSD